MKCHTQRAEENCFFIFFQTIFRVFVRIHTHKRYKRGSATERGIMGDIGWQGGGGGVVRAR